MHEAVLSATNHVVEEIVREPQLVLECLHEAEHVIFRGDVYQLTRHKSGVAEKVPQRVDNSRINYKGQTLPNSPAASGSLGLTQQWDLANGGFVEGRVATHYESSTWAFFAHLQGLEKPAYTKTDLSLSYHLPKNDWRVGLWVKNVENTATRVTPATTNVYGLQTWFWIRPGPSG